MTLKNDLQAIITDMIESPSKFTPIKTGFPSIDEHLHIQQGNVVVIAGKSSTGKTSLALNIALNIASKDSAVIFFSLEMAKREILLRILSCLLNIPLSDLVENKLDKEMLHNIFITIKGANEKLLKIIDGCSMTAEDIDKYIYSLKRSFNPTPLKAIFIDYLQIIKPSKESTSYTEATQKSRKIKNLAKAYSCPIFLLSQVNRSASERVRGCNTRDSGAIEEDADALIAIQPLNDEMRLKSSHPVNISVDKNRNGKLFNFTLQFNKPFCAFRNV